MKNTTSTSASIKKRVRNDSKKAKNTTIDKRSLGRKNNIVIASWPRKQIVDFWTTHMNNTTMTSNLDEPSSFDPCHIWNGSKQNGYPCVSQGHGKSKIKMHIISAWTRYKTFPIENQVVSHLCHRKLCINPNHLVIESIASNNARKGCLAAFHDNQNNVWCLCPHNPICLRSDTENNSDFKPFVNEIDVSSQ